MYIFIAMCIEANGLTRLRAPILEDTFLRDFMNVGLPREIFINDKPERFALIPGLLGRRLYEYSLCSHLRTVVSASS